jgi:hypothetical protein
MNNKMNNKMNNTAKIEKDSFKVFKNLLDKEEVEFYKNKIDAVFTDRENKNTFPNGLVESEGLWGLLENKKIIDKAKLLLGGDVKFLQHNDIHKNFSASGWHRDSVDRIFSKGQEWENNVDYGILRVGVYLQGEESKFKLGLIRNSNKNYINLFDNNNFVSRCFKFIDKICPLVFYRLFLKIINRDIELIDLYDGDIIMFDPRLLHKGTKAKLNKYSVFFSFAIENDHFVRFSDYYLKTRKDLKYSKISNELKSKLKNNNILADYYNEDF